MLEPGGEPELAKAAPAAEPGPPFSRQTGKRESHNPLVTTVVKQTGSGSVADAATSHLSNQRWAQSFFDIIDRAILAPDYLTAAAAD